jgi:hypothetical protein
MRRLRVPTDTAKETFSTCISTTLPDNLKDRLKSVEPLIESSDVEYHARVINNTLHQMHSGVAQFNGAVTKGELIAVYKKKMALKKSPGRPIYDRLISSAPNGKCPLCTIGSVMTLDHVLPKFKYPALAVAPLNLVPACRDCNFAKKTQIPTRPEDIYLHPYFDNVENDTWLVAIVSQPLAIKFDTQFPTGWSQLLQDRVRHHFDELGLAKLFGSNAANELSILEKRLEPLLNISAGEVENYLRGEANAHSLTHLNSWQTAMYAALAHSTWYINGGFRI